jgi:flagellar basal-body rod protein FlgC
MSISPINTAIAKIGASINVQNQRLLVLTENIVNAGTTSAKKGIPPYTKKHISFKETFDPQTNTNLMTVDKVFKSKEPFGKLHDPHHPAADEKGFIQISNVNVPIEMADLHETTLSQLAYTETFKKLIEAKRNEISILRS